MLPHDGPTWLSDGRGTSLDQATLIDFDDVARGSRALVREKMEGVNVNGYKDARAVDGGTRAHGRGAVVDGHEWVASVPFRGRCDPGHARGAAGGCPSSGPQVVMVGCPWAQACSWAVPH